MSIFLSIFAATCRPNNIVGFLDNLKETANDPSSFEVLLKLDKGATELISIIENYKKNSPLNIKYLETEVLDGYYSLDVGYNELLKLADPDTYFCWLLTDEIRLETKGWDSILQKHIGFFPDDIFRIKLSIFQLKNYHDFFECLPCPDNYAVTTRKWLEITGGWGNFWGPDSWHQCIDYYLGLCKNKDNPYGIWRSYPLFDIKVGGQEAGQGIDDPKKINERTRKIWYGWQKHSTHAAQENFKRLAQRLNIHIIAHSKSYEQYIMQEDLINKTVSLYDTNNKRQHTESYCVTNVKLGISVGHKNLKLVHIFNFLAIHRAFFHKQHFRIRRIKRFIIRNIRRVFKISLISIEIFLRAIVIPIDKLIAFILSAPAKIGFTQPYNAYKQLYNLGRKQMINIKTLLLADFTLDKMRPPSMRRGKKAARKITYTYDGNRFIRISEAEFYL